MHDSKKVENKIEEENIKFISCNCPQCGLTFTETIDKKQEECKHNEITRQQSGLYLCTCGQLFEIKKIERQAKEK